MTASTAITPVQEATTEYLEDIFMHARGSSRKLTAQRIGIRALFLTTGRAQPILLDADRVVELDDAIGDHVMAVDDFLAAIAPAALAHAQALAAVVRAYAQEATFDITPAQGDDLVRPLFEAAGLLDDFVPWQDLMPDWQEKAQ